MAFGSGQGAAEPRRRARYPGHSNPPDSLWENSTANTPILRPEFDILKSFEYPHFRAHCADSVVVITRRCQRLNPGSSPGRRTFSGIFEGKSGCDFKEIQFSLSAVKQWMIQFFFETFD